VINPLWGGVNNMKKDPKAKKGMRMRYRAMWWFIGMSAVLEEIHNFNLNPNQTLLVILIDITTYVISWLIVFTIVYAVYDFVMKLLNRNKTIKT